MAWIMDDELGRPINTEAPDIPQRPFVNDSPNKMWKIQSGRNNGMPITGLMPDRPLLGAFANATQLSQVSIPKSVKRIGEESFRNTQLTSVTIARD